MIITIDEMKEKQEAYLEKEQKMRHEITILKADLARARLEIYDLQQGNDLLSHSNKIH